MCLTDDFSGNARAVAYKRYGVSKPQSPRRVQMYEYEVVFHVTLPRPLEEMIPDQDDRVIANIADVADECVMEIKEFKPQS